MRALYSIIVIFAVFGSSSLASSSDKIDEYANYLAEKHQFDYDYIFNTLKAANKNQAILEAIASPWEAKPWFQYHPIFVTDKRIDKGVKFWQKHEEALTRAESELGVPAQLIVAIIGVETFYGTYTGKYSALDALYTLSFHYPRRSKFFKRELEEYFLLVRDEGFDPYKLKGSYAAAMGWGQFISSSYRHYAIDFDNDGVRDLFNNPVDAIGSVANYFKKNGWKANQDVAYPATIDNDNQQQHLAYISKSLKFKHSWQQLSEAGVSIADKNKLTAKTKVKLLHFDIGDSFETENLPVAHANWVGLHNFYVITRYNHSPLYAMAVYQLSEQIKARKQSQ